MLNDIGDVLTGKVAQRRKQQSERLFEALQSVVERLNSSTFMHSVGVDEMKGLMVAQQTAAFQELEKISSQLDSAQATIGALGDTQRQGWEGLGQLDHHLRWARDYDRELLDNIGSILTKLDGHVRWARDFDREQLDAIANGVSIQAVLQDQRAMTVDARFDALRQDVRAATPAVDARFETLHRDLLSVAAGIETGGERRLADLGRDVVGRLEGVLAGSEGEHAESIGLVKQDLTLLHSRLIQLDKDQAQRARSIEDGLQSLAFQMREMFDHLKVESPTAPEETSTSEPDMSEVSGVFIVGHARSGTSVLAGALNSSPDLYIFGEPYLYIEAERTDFRDWYNDMHAGLGNPPQKGTYCPALLDGSATGFDYMQALSKVYRRVGEKAAFRDVSMGYDLDRYLEFQERYFFRGKYVCITRNPGGVIGSCLRMFGDDQPLLYARSYLAVTRCILHICACFPDARLVLHETLDARALGKLAEFLDADLSLASRHYDPDHQKSSVFDLTAYYSEELTETLNWAYEQAIFYQNPKDLILSDRLGGLADAQMRLAARIAELDYMIAEGVDAKTPPSQAQTVRPKVDELAEGQAKPAAKSRKPAKA